MAGMSATHEVINQSTPFVDRNLYAVDVVALQEGVTRLGAGWAESELTSLGTQLGSGRVAEWARLANAFPPQLRTSTATAAASTRSSSTPPGTR